ncbi:MAG TPA: LysM domain-containing protein [Solirubrobacteraceae bacterium]|jgi:LysM repeat protein
MARRSPARFLAPVALAGVAVAMYLVIAHSLPSDTGSKSPSSAHQTKTSKTAGKTSKHKRHRRRTYTVKPGDTPSGIAVKTGVSLATLQRLNPKLDPQSLSPGQKIRLRR